MNNNDGGPRLRRRAWLVAATGPALLAACGGGDPAVRAPGVPAAAPALAPMADLPPGEVSEAFFTYLQLSAGKSLNALQALRRTAVVKASPARAALLDQWIARQSELLASLRGFQASLAPLRAGTVSSVVLAPASATHRAMVLDRVGLAAMDTTIGHYLVTLLGLAPPQAAAAGRHAPMFSVGDVTTALRFDKNVFALDKAIFGSTSNPAQTALAIAGGVVAVAVIGALVAGVAVPAGVVAAGAAVGAIAGGMAIFTGLVNAAASGYAVLEAQNPADAAAQWQGVWGGVRQIAEGVVDTAAAAADPLRLRTQALGFANNAMKSFDVHKQSASDMAGVLRDVVGSSNADDGITAVNISAPNLPDGARDGPTTASLGSGDERVEAPLDASGDGRMLVPGSTARAPGALCVNDPDDGTLLAINPVTALLDGMTILVLSARCGFAGSYSGSFAGTDHGPVSATLTSSGAVTASGSSLRFGNPIAATGSVSTSGQFLAVAGTSTDGAVFTGSLQSTATGWSLSGTWSNARTGLAGTFALTRSGCS